MQQALPDFAGQPKWILPAPAGVGATLEFNSGAPSAIKAALDLNFNRSSLLGGSTFQIGLNAAAGVSVLLPIAPPGPARVSGSPFDVAIGVSRTNDVGTIVIGSDALGATLAIGEIGIALKLANGEPRLGFFARKAKARLQPTDGFLKLILGDGIALDFAVEAEADRFGQLRLTNGTGLKASLPLPTLPTGRSSCNRSTSGSSRTATASSS